MLAIHDLQDGEALCFDVLEGSRLPREQYDAHVLGHAQFQNIRLLAYDGKKWIIDPRPKTVESYCELKVYDKKPLSKLQWDPCE